MNFILFSVYFRLHIDFFFASSLVAFCSHIQRAIGGKKVVSNGKADVEAKISNYNLSE